MASQVHQHPLLFTIGELTTEHESRMEEWIGMGKKSFQIPLLDSKLEYNVIPFGMIFVNAPNMFTNSRKA